MEEKLLYKIYISGHVQGVGFRWGAVRKATKMGIRGYVKNLSDGRVYIEAEGTRDQLSEFVDWCMKGPGFVSSVIYDSFPPVNYHDFGVEY
jgi:acylphosphatase